MEQKAVLQQIRADISKANTKQALASLQHYLDQAGSDAVEAYNRVVQLSAQYEQTQRSEKFGMVSFEDAKVSYNQINNGVLAILQDLEGSTPSTDTDLVLKTKKSNKWLIRYKSEFLPGSNGRTSRWKCYKRLHLYSNFSL